MHQRMGDGKLGRGRSQDSGYELKLGERETGFGEGGQDEDGGGQCLMGKFMEGD